MEMQEEYQDLAKKQEQDTAQYSKTEEIKKQHLNQLQEFQNQLLQKENEMLESKKKIDSFETELVQRERDKEMLHQEAELRAQEYAKEAEKMKREREKLESEKKETEVQVMNLTGGLGYNVWKQVHLKNHEEDDKECIVCMERPPQVRTKPCNHKIICEECLEDLPKKVCPKCNAPIQSISLQ